MKMYHVADSTRAKLDGIADYLFQVMNLHETTEYGTLSKQDETTVANQMEKVASLQAAAAHQAVTGFTIHRIKETIDAYANILATPAAQRVYGSY